eukprot:Plantae.Rhodophyta-Rhodochaete_pulchella.ctg10425.p1 GENE.Plantae.Rhodophyta-Rhodochaete_pulchella.ctg10425~~Plantae.Rhodophyta-Rhodochaete_pulchella.ctg10425.p1  ORF type:complete len:244 (+),score=27.88 Plantae.Rhodophyta-Rhodochaete_pulchella.ctg10425:693-1424(+)
MEQASTAYPEESAAVESRELSGGETEAVEDAKWVVRGTPEMEQGSSAYREDSTAVGAAELSSGETEDAVDTAKPLVRETTEMEQELKECPEDSTAVGSAELSGGQTGDAVGDAKPIVRETTEIEQESNEYSEASAAVGGREPFNEPTSFGECEGGSSSISEVVLRNSRPCCLARDFGLREVQMNPSESLAGNVVPCSDVSLEQACTETDYGRVRESSRTAMSQSCAAGTLHIFSALPQGDVCA